MTPGLRFRVIHESNFPWQGDGIFPSLRSLRLSRLRTLRIFSLTLSRFGEKMTPLREHPVPLPGTNSGALFNTHAGIDPNHPGFPPPPPRGQALRGNDSDAVVNSACHILHYAFPIPHSEFPNYPSAPNVGASGSLIHLLK